VRTGQDEARRVLRLEIDGMTCPTCEATLQGSLGRLPGVVSVKADYRAGRVAVTLEAGSSVRMLRAAVEDAGYDLKDDAVR
jgi:copper chaperone CopZ